MDMIAVGPEFDRQGVKDRLNYLPSVISLDVPRRQYTKTPIKEEYRPYCAGKLARFAYARP